MRPKSAGAFIARLLILTALTTCAATWIAYRFGDRIDCALGTANATCAAQERTPEVTEK